MRVDVLVETIYQSVQGGKPSPDSSVKRIDILAYLPAAINYAVAKEFYVGVQSERDYNILPKQFVGTYEDVKVEYSEPRDLKYIIMPATPIALMKDNGIEMIAPMQGNATFSPIRGQFELAGYEQYTGGITRWWLEGNKVYFSNISPVVKGVLVRMIASVDDLKGDQQAPIPAGMEAQVIDIAVNYFKGERLSPQDNNVNNVDDRQQ